MSYCPSIYKTKRFETREVYVGRIGIGGTHPIRVQSMTTYDACLVDQNVEQILRLEEKGCEIVRLAIQGKKQVEGIEKIKEKLDHRGSKIPLVADVHFFPDAALWVADIADKVRINPGNFLKINPQEIVLEKIEEKLLPLIQKCKKRGISLRLGSNSGSLSERILYLYGNTPKGMVFSALEFAEVLRKHNFHDFLFSMKASNPLTTIAAYRLLVAEMIQKGWNYPLHLGVTEAGEGEEGRIKSSVGIGALLLDGIGDTIRVSLTEDPEHEITPAFLLAKMAREYEGRGVDFFEENHRKPLVVSSKKQALLYVKMEGQNHENILQELGDDCSIDGIFLPQVEPSLSSKLAKGGIIVKSSEDPSILKLSSDRSAWPKICSFPQMILFQPTISPLHETRLLFEHLQRHAIQVPLLLDFPTTEPLILAAELGSLLCDHLADGIVLNCPGKILFGLRLLQACRRRMSHTEFISCPGCGRTQFDLQNTVQWIKKSIPHFPGVTIAVMGCIVNGPGEMEDADFGVVGSKEGLVDLYVKKRCVERDVDPREAKDKLLSLIQKSLSPQQN